MAITRRSKSVVLTAAGDEATGVYDLMSLALVGTGMAAGQRILIEDSFGSILADHYVEAANENVEFITGGCYFCRGIKLVTVPAGGTWTVVARHR
jgi:hypothetical protein